MIRRDARVLTSRVSRKQVLIVEPIPGVLLVLFELHTVSERSADELCCGGAQAYPGFLGQNECHAAVDLQIDVDAIGYTIKPIYCGVVRIRVEVIVPIEKVDVLASSRLKQTIRVVERPVVHIIVQNSQIQFRVCLFIGKQFCVSAIS